MNNLLIENMLNCQSENELNEIINQRINEEKQEYRKSFHKKRCEDLKQKGKLTNDFLNQDINSDNFDCKSFIAPPSNNEDLSLNVFEDFLDSKNVTIYIASSWPSYPLAFDDENEIYKILAFELSKTKPKSNQDIFNAVSETVFNYIGGVKVLGDDFSRLALLKPSSELDDGEKNNISVFKGKQKAWCVERACIAHQLFKFLGVDSKIIMTTISNNGENQIHAFNLLKTNSKTVLFDCSVMNPPKNNEKYNAVAFLLPENVYDNNITNVDNLPNREITGLSGKKYTIIYDLQNRKINENVNSNSL